jgi:hypothetical protein
VGTFRTQLSLRALGSPLAGYYYTHIEDDPQELISACFPGSKSRSLLVADLLGTANHGLADGNWENRATYVHALKRLMMTWRGEVPSIINTEKYINGWSITFRTSKTKPFNSTTSLSTIISGVHPLFLVAFRMWHHCIVPQTPRRLLSLVPALIGFMT